MRLGTLVLAAVLAVLLGGCSFAARLDFGGVALGLDHVGHSMTRIGTHVGIAID